MHPAFFIFAVNFYLATSVVRSRVEKNAVLKNTAEN